MKKAILAFLSIVACVLITGCAAQKPEPTEFGFTETSDTDTTYRCAYRLERTEFDISNVTITAFYGQFEETILGTAPSNLVYRIYFVGTEPSDPWYETAHFIKELNGNDFLSEDYLCSGMKNANGTTEWSFRHSEILKIPEKLFDKPNGSISFVFKEYLTDLGQFASGKSFTVHYRVDEKKVILSIPNNN